MNFGENNRIVKPPTMTRVSKCKKDEYAEVLRLVMHKLGGKGINSTHSRVFFVLRGVSIIILFETRTICKNGDKS